MNLQDDITTKAFYAKELPESFPVNKTIRQHYVSQNTLLMHLTSEALWKYSSKLLM